MLALVTDLIFSTKIASTAKSLGREVKIVRSPDRWRELLGTDAHRVVLVDLDSDVDAIEAIRIAKCATPVRNVIAYVSHVRADLIAAAREAGADEVMARSAFVQKLNSIIEQSAD